MQLILSWRLRQQHLPHVSVLHDMRITFACTNWDELGRTNEQMMMTEGCVYGEQRFRWSSTVVSCRDGEHEGRPAQGGFMGDAYVVRTFAKTFQRPVGEWQMMQAARGDGCHDVCRAKCVVTGEVVDSKKLVAPWLAGQSASEVVAQFEELIEGSLLSLSEELAPYGYALNSKKTVLLPSFQGARAWTAHKASSDKLGAKYEVAGAARELGGCLDAQLATGEEVRTRCRASRLSFFQMGSLWLVKGLPIGFRRSMMMALVQGSLLSGLKSFLLRDKHMQKLGMVMAGLLRLAMRGRDSGRTEAGYKAMSNEAVLAC